MSLTLLNTTSHCILDDVPYNAASIITVIVFSFVGLLMMIGLAVDLTIHLKAWLKERENERFVEDDEVFLIQPSAKTAASSELPQSVESSTQARYECK